jgi:pyridoxal phosphate enzyme (YggS family)
MDTAAVAANLDRVGEEIAAACAHAGRDPAAVRLVAVSKRIDAALVVAACRAGQWHLGENRVQDALARQDGIAGLLADAGLPPDRVNWHFIGHLQGNKAARASGRFALLHGVDSLRLAERLSRLAAADGRREPVLLEVNVAAESRKHGFAPAELPDALAAAATLPGLDLRGLMTMARFGADEAELRGTFGGLRRLAEDGRTASGLPLPELSMGMSADYREAVLEGATIVRIGGAIFGPRT